MTDEAKERVYALERMVRQGKRDREFLLRRAEKLTRERDEARAESDFWLDRYRRSEAELLVARGWATSTEDLPAAYQAAEQADGDQP